MRASQPYSAARPGHFHNQFGVIPLTNPEMIGLARLSPELRAMTVGEVPSYHKLWTYVADGRIPATLVNNRYQVRRSDLPGICATLGLRIKGEIARGESIPSEERQPAAAA
jgi:hypothetical protein